MVKEEYEKHIIKREVNSIIQTLENEIQNMWDLIGDLQKGKITAEDIPQCYKDIVKNEI
tara:strand:+ start:111 stop:287 length:177 start_codon:yes stop_codon:yes gene_type:complete